MLLPRLTYERQKALAGESGDVLPRFFVFAAGDTKSGWAHQPGSQDVPLFAAKKKHLQFHGILFTIDFGVR